MGNNKQFLKFFFINAVLLSFSVSAAATGNKRIAEPATKNSGPSTQAMQARLDRIADLRETYLKAETALKKKDYATYNKLKRRLTDYPLYSILLYNEYMDRIKTLTHREVTDYLSRYGNSSTGNALRFHWMIQLSKRGQWRRLVNLYSPSGGSHQHCLYLRGLMHTGKRRKAMSEIQRMWLTSKSLSGQCDPVIKKWHASGGLTRKLVLDRIEFLFDKRHKRAALALRKWLPKRDRALVTMWYQVHRKPRRMMNKTLLRSKSSIAKKVIAHGLQRMARSKPEDAIKIMKSFKNRKFSKAQIAAVKRQAGLTYSYRKDYAKASYWLAQVPNSLADREVKMWRFRTALAQQNWRKVLHWLKHIDAEDKKDERFIYWRARALEKLGQRKLARSLYHKVSKSRSFEGFLASDRLKKPYSFESRNLYYPERELVRIESIPGILRARELYFLDRKMEARREWWVTIKSFLKNETKMKKAAVVAHRWGWHDRVILTLGKTTFRDDLKMRFPITHKNKVIKHASNKPVAPAWAMAVIRRESAFMVDARSRVGARGLMQLMPRTARYVARTLKTRVRRKDLYKANTNIRLGVQYLSMELEKFSGHPVLATAAYNAGPHRVIRWLPKQGKKPADIWIETIPFKETRNYCRAVMEYTTIYERRMGLKMSRITDRLKPVHQGLHAKNSSVKF